MDMILGFLKSIVELYSASIPSPVIGVLLLVASFRLVLKPLFSFAYTITAITPSPKDDMFVKKVEDGKIVKVIKYALDWLASIKFPAKK